MEKARKKEVTIKSLLYHYYTNREGLHPVKIQVTSNRTTRFYPVQYEGKNIFLNPEQWLIVCDGVRDKYWNKIADAIKDAEANARDGRRVVTQNNRPFTFERFEKEFLQADSGKGFIKIFERCLRDLLREDRIGTHKSYNNALQAFKSFRKEKDLSPADITPALLKDFESYLSKPRTIKKRKEKVKAGKNTIAIYIRALKVVYNIAAADYPYLKELYPFAATKSDRGKYKIKTAAGKKAIALAVEDIQKFIEAPAVEKSPEWKAKHVWLFSFYCQGMNYRDIALLKYQDIEHDAIRYVRRKTRDTESHQEQMEVPLLEPIQEIILEIGNPDKHPQSYVFGILTDGLSASRQDSLIRQGIKTTNKWLKRYCKTNKLPEITTYSARHSYANLLKQTGVSVELIRELLGHSDIRTTESYLEKFGLERKEAANKEIHKILKVS
jgi:integrase